jgi:putative membrane protein
LALAVGLHVVVLLAWHLPVLFQAALDHDPVHGLEHVTMLVSALAAWAALTGLGREVPPFAVLVLFFATLAMTALGFAMMIARTPWYAAYARRPGALGDQQLAGVLMWGYGGGAAVIGGVLLFTAWLRQAERRTPARAFQPAVAEEGLR